MRDTTSPPHRHGVPQGELTSSVPTILTPQTNSITAPPFCVSTFIKQCFVIYTGYAVAQLLWVYELNAGRSRGSIPDGVKFHPSGRTTALGPTQPRTEMSTTDISWRVKATGADFLQILEVSTSWSPKCLSRPVIGIASFVSYTDKYRVGLRYWHPFVPVKKCIQLRHAKIYLHYSILLCWNNKQTVGHNSVFLVIQYLIQHVSACTSIIRCQNYRIDLLKTSRCAIVNSFIPKKQYKATYILQR